MTFDSYDVHGQLKIKQNQVERFMEVYAIFFKNKLKYC